jgi:hypothetical protein
MGYFYNYDMPRTKGAKGKNNKYPFEITEVWRIYKTKKGK